MTLSDGRAGRQAGGRPPFQFTLTLALFSLVIVGGVASVLLVCWFPAAATIVHLVATVAAAGLEIIRQLGRDREQR